MILPGSADGNLADLIVSFGRQNLFGRSGITFAKTRCVQVSSNIGSSGHIAMDFSITNNRYGVSVKPGWRLTQTPYKILLRPGDKAQFVRLHQTGVRGDDA